MFGGPIVPPPIPGPEVFDVGREPEMTPDATPWEQLEDFVAGSNNWALAGSRTADGRAWVANDMHLHLRVPGVWYRVRLDRPEDDGSKPRLSVIGVTLPGGPGIVVGSNSRIAWGFTNTQGDWSDLVELEIPGDNPDAYLSPDGLRPFDRHREVIKVKGGADVDLTVEATIWGPVLGKDHRGRKRALRWVAEDPMGVDLGLLDLSSSQSLEEGLDRANRCGAPHQNIVIADDGGRIGWTILGRMPRRRPGFDGRLPASWADGSKGWDGYRAPSESPRLVDPPTGQLWTANARVGDGEVLDKIGDGGYDRGARAKQIRDRLTDLVDATAKDLLELQLDDRALFLDRWRSVLLDSLTPEAVARDARRRPARSRRWLGREGLGRLGRLPPRLGIPLENRSGGALAAHGSLPGSRPRVPTPRPAYPGGTCLGAGQPSAPAPARPAIWLVGGPAHRRGRRDARPGVVRRDDAGRADLGPDEHGADPAPAQRRRPLAGPLAGHAGRPSSRRMVRHAPDSGARFRGFRAPDRLARPRGA